MVKSKKQTYSQRYSRHNGQSLVIIAFISIVLICSIGLAIDISNALVTQEMLQEQADQAAQSGAQQIQALDTEGSVIQHPHGGSSSVVLDPSAGVTAAHDFLIKNTDERFSGTNAYKIDAITVSSDNSSIMVKLSAKSETYFMGILGFSYVPVSVTGTAEFAQGAGK